MLRTFLLLEKKVLQKLAPVPLSHVVSSLIQEALDFVVPLRYFCGVRGVSCFKGVQQNQSQRKDCDVSRNESDCVPFSTFF